MNSFFSKLANLKNNSYLCQILLNYFAMTKLPDVTLMSQIARATILWIFLMTAGVACAAAPDNEQPVVEMRGDRTLIYPQRMELSGEETLMDILDMYPDLHRR
jgi:hypothetical protein